MCGVEMPRLTWYVGGAVLLSSVAEAYIIYLKLSERQREAEKVAEAELLGMQRVRQVIALLTKRRPRTNVERVGFVADAQIAHERMTFGGAEPDAEAESSLANLVGERCGPMQMRETGLTWTEAARSLVAFVLYVAVFRVIRLLASVVPDPPLLLLSASQSIARFALNSILEIEANERHLREKVNDINESSGEDSAAPAPPLVAAPRCWAEELALFSALQASELRRLTIVAPTPPGALGPVAACSAPLGYPVVPNVYGVVADMATASPVIVAGLCQLVYVPGGSAASSASQSGVSKAGVDISKSAATTEEIRKATYGKKSAKTDPSPTESATEGSIPLTMRQQTISAAACATRTFGGPPASGRRGKRKILVAVLRPSDASEIHRVVWEGEDALNELITKGHEAR